MELSSSLEDYLEAIYSEVLKNGSAKVTDIAAILNVKKASVTGALNTLAKKELVNYAPYSAITLTSKGEKIAKDVTKRHQVMTDFFKNILHLSEREAIENACKMEHVMSEKMFKRMMKFSAYMNEMCEKHPDIKENIKNMYN